MKVNEILDEDWKSALANTAMAGALVGTGYWYAPIKASK